MSTESVYAKIANRILEALETADPSTWVTPWVTARGARNGFTGRPYTGANAVLLPLLCRLNGWHDPRFGTFNQVRKAGGHIRKGERGVPVIHAAVHERAPKPGEKPNTEDNTVRYVSVRHYTVFNLVAQAEGLDLPPVATVRTHTPNELDSFIQATGARISNGPKAFYRPSEDVIVLPPASSFITAAGYYATILHELVHWTAHPSRLDRPMKPLAIDPDAYAHEEIIAELGSAFLCSIFGVDSESQHPAYIASWFRRVASDPKAFIQAATHATNATNYLLRLTGYELPDEASDDEAAA